MDEVSHRIAGWFAGLPRENVVVWSSDHLTTEIPWTTAWIDVQIPRLQPIVEANWIFTIIGPNDSDTALSDRPSWEMIVDYDLDVHRIYDPHPPNRWFVIDIPVPLGQKLTRAQEEQLAATLHGGPDRRRDMNGGWSVACVQKAMEGWVAEFAGRHDLCFEWDAAAGPSPMLAQAINTIEQMNNGEADSYQISEGVEVSDQVMDFMLALPDDERSFIATEIIKLKPDGD